VIQRRSIAVAVVVSVAVAALLAGCAPFLQASPTATTTPSTYTVVVPAARTLAIRDLRARGGNDWATLYADRKASACFVRHWPSVAAYKGWWLANWGPMSSGPGEVPGPSAPFTVLSVSGDDQHQIVVLQSLDPTFMTPPKELYVLRQFAAGWAILNWLPYEISDVSPPYRVASKYWDPCVDAVPYTPDDPPVGQ
jgi:hypothetical protein